MTELDRSDLLSLEQYDEQRAAFRARVMEHKKSRIVALGDNATLHFEDRLTVKYQVQEMLRAERTFEAAAIEEELQAYGPLIPDGSNWKATLMLEYDDAEQRKRMLARLIGVERAVWVCVEGHEPVYAIADEDLERETAEKTSSVHFLRFELDAAMIAAVKGDVAITVGCDHPEYPCQLTLPQRVRESLSNDLHP